MELKELLTELEKHINVRMEELTKIGQQCKKLQKQIIEKQDKMASIFKSLKPVHAVIREQNPHMNELFDAILEECNDESV